MMHSIGQPSAMIYKVVIQDCMDSILTSVSSPDDCLEQVEGILRLKNTVTIRF